MENKTEAKALQQRAQFGKYKGKLISWIVENDPSYAEWLSKRPTKQKTQKAAQSLIDKRDNKLKQNGK